MNPPKTSPPLTIKSLLFSNPLNSENPRIIIPATIKMRPLLFINSLIIN